MNNGLIEYICLAVVLIAIALIVIVIAARNRKKTRASSSLASKPGSSNPPTGNVSPPVSIGFSRGYSNLSEPQRPNAKSSGRIFISYRRSDSADVAGRIYDRLVDKFGRSLIFKDVDSIPLGIDFREFLDKKVSECDVLLAIIGDSWVDASNAKGEKRLEDPADFVRIEIESALERGIPVIPLLVRGAQMPTEASLPPSLRKLIYRNGIQVRADPDFHHDMDRLISALNSYLR